MWEPGQMLLALPQAEKPLEPLGAAKGALECAGGLWLPLLQPPEPGKAREALITRSHVAWSRPLWGIVHPDDGASPVSLPSGAPCQGPWTHKDGA